MEKKGNPFQHACGLRPLPTFIRVRLGRCARSQGLNSFYTCFVRSELIVSSLFTMASVAELADELASDDELECDIAQVIEGLPLEVEIEGEQDYVLESEEGGVQSDIEIEYESEPDVFVDESEESLFSQADLTSRSGRLWRTQPPRSAGRAATQNILRNQNAGGIKPGYYPSSELEAFNLFAANMFGTGGNITTDQWFTSSVLSDHLKAKKLSLVGTVRSNRVDVPAAAKSLDGRERGDSRFFYYWTRYWTHLRQ